MMMIKKSIIILLVFIINTIVVIRGQVNCITTPSDPSCVDFIYPNVNITQDLNNLCSKMSYMTTCSLQQACQSAGSSSGVCEPFALLADGCQYDMPTMGGCRNYGSLCNQTAGSVVKECKTYQAIPSLANTKMVNQLVYNICTSMNMDSCSSCPISTTPYGSYLKCDILLVYSQLCQQMPDMSECQQWSSMCNAGLSSTQLSATYCHPPLSEQVPLMRMYFHTGLLDYILFESWVPRSPKQYAGYWFLIFFFAIIFELEKTARSILEKKWEAQRQLELEINGDESLISRGYFKGSYPSFNFRVDVTRGLLQGLELTMSYLLMLVAMTYNVALFFSVIAGTVVGSILLGRFRSYKPKNSCCD